MMVLTTGVWACAHAPAPNAADRGAQEPRACFNKTCEDDLTITLGRGFGSMDPVAAELTIGGLTIRCPAPEPNRASPCSPAGTVDLKELTDCSRRYKDDTGWHACTPLGRFEQVIEVPVARAPSTVEVTLLRNGRKIASRTFQPRSENNEINGDWCECQHAHETWVVSRRWWW